ncbi:MAG: TetM/TetW/TetO/TetS family tetracycline resistance ribosomal protection protein [Lachnospiraceae bacterium]|nr:TetM/TetW/TetO/TetS family tetracycline resistance ribosomal protection protein [Lachnospiraceae bacterium]
MSKLVLGILAHVDAGKTTLSEALLYTAGSIKRFGRVDRGESFLDGEEIERARGVTVFSKQARLCWKDTDIVFLDTPGHVDFSPETERTLSVLDYAILVISAPDGVQSHTRTLMRLLSKYHIPTFIFVNKMDLTEKTMDEVISDIREKLCPEAVMLPTGGGELSADNCGDEGIEEIAGFDEALIEEYFENGVLSEASVRRSVAGRRLFPVFFGSALHQEGITELLDGIAGLSEKKPVPGEFGARVYKIGWDKKGERLTHVRLTGGSVRPKDVIVTKRGVADEEGAVTDEISEKIQGIRLYEGERFEAVDGADAVEICTLLGLDNTYTGQGLGFEEDALVPELSPVLSYQVIPPKEVTAGKLFETLKVLNEEEPTFGMTHNEHTGDIMVQLMGPFQLEVLQQEIKRRFGFLVTFGPGKILYKETIASSAYGVGHFEPLRHYAEAHLLLEPGEPGSGIEIDNACPVDILSVNYQKQVVNVLERARLKGVLTGAPLTDVKITLVSGKSHTKHTEGGDFSQASRRAVRQGLMKAESVILEPVFDLVLRVPQSMVGRAMTDLERMHGKLLPPEIENDQALLRGRVPVACITDYARDVASYTGGLGELTLDPGGYEPCHNAEEVIEKAGYDPEADMRNPTGSVFCAQGAGYVVPWYEVEEMMHMPCALSSGEESEDEDAAMQRMALARAEAARRSAEAMEPKGFRGYSGMEKELEGIFVREFGEIKSSIKNRDVGKRERNYDDPVEREKRVREAREEYKAAHGSSSEKKPAAKLPRFTIIDGYNVIFVDNELKDLAKDDLHAARTKLLDIVADYQGYVGDEVIVVFDAWRKKGGTGSSERYGSLYVEFTKEAQTADAYIERAVHELMPGAHITVVTSDAAEQVIVSGSGAYRMSSREFFDEIKRLKMG